MVQFYSASEGIRVFGLLCNALLLSLDQYDVGRVWCGELHYDKGLGALALPGFARMRLHLDRSEQEPGLNDIIVRSVN